MATEKEKLDWTTVNTLAFAPSVQPLWDAYQASIKATSKARDDFQTALVKDMHAAGNIPAGMETVFGYKFGRFSVAFVEAGTNQGSGGAKVPVVLGTGKTGTTAASAPGKSGKRGTRELLQGAGK